MGIRMPLIIPLDVLGVTVTLIEVHVHANALPTSQPLGILDELHELFVGGVRLNHKARLTERGEGLLYLLTYLLRVKLLCLVNEGRDGLSSSDHLILEHDAIEVTEGRIYITRDLLPTVMLQTVCLGCLGV